MKWDESYFRSRKHHVDDAVLVEISKTADFYLLICKKILILAFYVFYRLLRLSWEPGEKSNFFYNVSVKIIFISNWHPGGFISGKDLNCRTILAEIDAFQLFRSLQASFRRQNLIIMKNLFYENIYVKFIKQNGFSAF